MTSSHSPVFILPFFPSSSFFRFRACIPVVPCCESVCDRRTPSTVFPSSQTPDCPLACRYRDTAKIPLTACTLNSCATRPRERTHPFLPITHWHRRSRTRTVRRASQPGSEQTVLESSQPLSFLAYLHTLSDFLGSNVLSHTSCI